MAGLVRTRENNKYLFIFKNTSPYSRVKSALSFSVWREGRHLLVYLEIKLLSATSLPTSVWKFFCSLGKVCLELLKLGLD